MIARARPHSAVEGGALRRACVRAGKLVLAAIAVSAAVFASELGLKGQDGSAVAALQPGQFIKRTLPGRTTHAYVVGLESDRTVELRIEQHDVDPSIRVLDPDGGELLKSDARAGLRASRSFPFIAPASGDYRVELTSGGVEAAGDYVVSMTLPRAPSAAERTLEEARLLAVRSRALIEHGKYDDAVTPATRSLELRASVPEAGQPVVADALHLLADIYDKKGDYQTAEPINRRALAIREKTLGPDHPDVARSLFNLAWIYQVRQDYARSEAAYERVLSIQERAFGVSSRDVATTLNDLAIMHEKKGEYEQAIDIDRRVLAIRERLLGPSDAAVALTLNNLGLGYVKVGNYAEAEPCFTRALEIYENARGPGHPDIATPLNNLAMLYENKGDYIAAEPLHWRALAIDEAARGPNHPNVAAYLNNLAWLYQRRGDYARAEPLYRRALAIRESSLGPSHSDVGEALNNLASLYLTSGQRNDTTIEALLQRSLVIMEHALGAESEKLAMPLSTLARLHDRQGDLARAEAEYQRALALREKTLGERHPNVAMLLDRLALVSGRRGHVAEAFTYWQRYAAVRETNIAHNLPIGSDRQKLGYLGLFADDINHLLSFHSQLAPSDPAALRLAITALLRRKGRALDELADTVKALRLHASPDQQGLLTELTESRARLAAVTLRGPGSDDPAVFRARVARIEAQVDEIEAKVSVRSAIFRAESQPTTLEAVEAALPPDTALVEFAIYTPTAARTSASSGQRYAAYVVFSDVAPAWVDLGEATPIDRMIARWRRALRDPHRQDVQRLARAVDARIMQPVRARLGNLRQLFVSPDGQLHLVPFAALVDERGDYLVDRYTITYLTSGRDLLRLQVPRARGTAPVVVADPTFGDPAIINTTGRPDGRARVDDSQMFFSRLPGVAGEVQALRSLLPQAVFFTGQDATKATLTQVRAPQLLHVATHGFFLADVAEAGPERRDVEPTRLARRVVDDVQNPLLRSGLALAGANDGSTDGVLTALETASLDLWGTQLVVLSACDTGVGDIKNGEGVYGLRRALVLAGSESQMISLWPVADKSTRDLMVGFYSALRAGSGRSDALRDVQRKMRRDAAHGHPYYWAGFVLSGKWSTIEP